MDMKKFNLFILFMLAHEVVPGLTVLTLRKQ